MQARRLVYTGVIAVALVLAAFAVPSRAGSSTVCASGSPTCLTTTLAQQTRILGQTGPACNHRAVFALAYVRMTQTYGWTRTQAGYYHDVRYMNRMDAIFAKYYTDAYANYVNGRRSSVPRAWLYAFDAAKNKTVTGAGDLFLGMNAHINRDLPFVIYESGLVESDGTSGKGDYVKVEQWLKADTAPLLAEEAQRFDPRMDDTSNPLINSTAFQMVSSWRETAWRNAVALANARDSADRAKVAQNIESYADSVARGMLTSFAVNPLVETNAARDAYCAVHNGNRAPQRYPMGWPAPYGNSVR